MTDPRERRPRSGEEGGPPRAFWRFGVEAVQGLTTAEASGYIGRGVVYQPHADAPIEQGYITSVNDTYVFVRYGSDANAKATRPEDLRWLHA